MTGPIVSIIIPAYNRASLIGETLDSVQEQDFSSIELIVIDDGSTDTTAGFVRNWIELHKSRFTGAYLRSFEKNMGKSEAVNAGFAMAQGDYVMVLDSDDVLLPKAISTEIQFFVDHPDVDALFAGAFMMDDRTRTTKLVHTTQHSPSFIDVRISYGDMLLNGNCIVASTVMMKRAVVKAVGGFRKELRYTHDLDYWVRICKEHTFGYVDQPVLYYRMNVGDGSSLQLRRTFSEILRLLDERAGEYPFRSMVHAILFQTKFHIIGTLSRRSYVQTIMVALNGAVSIFKYLLFRRVH
ncbi:MAG: glycosyltransferase [Bacteroidota bacterium]